MNESEDTNQQNSEFVARVDTMNIQDVRSDFYDLFSEALTIEEQEGAA
jgi:hypothetical protein